MIVEICCRTNIGLLAISFLILTTAPLTMSEAQDIPTSFSLKNLKIEYYDVDGTDEASINASLNANAPRRPDGSRAMGMTSPYFIYTALQNTRDNICTVTELKIEVQSTMHLPRLLRENAVSEQLRIRWRSFMDALREHEMGHVRIGNEHLQDIRKSAIGSRCDQIDIIVHREADKIEALQKAYDAETRNGITQGALLR